MFDGLLKRQASHRFQRIGHARHRVAVAEAWAGLQHHLRQVHPHEVPGL